jgi:hypothetical protein
LSRQFGEKSMVEVFECAFMSKSCFAF